MKKLILFGDNEYALYHPLKAVESIFKKVFKDCSLYSTDLESDFTDLLKMGCDALILYVDRFEKPLKQETNQGILDFIKSGGKLLIIHNGISVTSDRELFDVIAAKFIGHPPYQKLQIQKNEDHVLLEGIHSFSIEEEPYQFEIKGDLGQVLLSYQLENQLNPAYWFKDYGAGKVFYLMFGHDLKTFENEVFLKLLENFKAYI